MNDGEEDKVVVQNTPSLDHISAAKDRARALMQHRIFEEQMDEYPEHVLQEAVSAGLHAIPPRLRRQQAAFLIARYCCKHRVGKGVLKRLITRVGGQLEGGVLLCKDEEVFNLLALNDVALRRVYSELPDEHAKRFAWCAPSSTTPSTYYRTSKKCRRRVHFATGV